ncbi:MAG: hypothetical protein ABI830_01365 [Pseudolabrys sp.]
MKRSSQVALLLMGVTTAGATSYAFLPSRDCVAPDKPAALAPGAINPQTLAPSATPCEPNRRSSRSYWASRSNNNTTTTRRSGWGGWFSRSSSRTSFAPTGTRSGSSGTSSRGGFGSTGHGHSSGS